jgi:hypothetical protein
MNKEIERQEKILEERLEKGEITIDQYHNEVRYMRLDYRDSMREPATSYSEGEQALEELYTREGRL